MYNRRLRYDQVWTRFEFTPRTFVRNWGPIEVEVLEFNETLKFYV